MNPLTVIEKRVGDTLFSAQKLGRLHLSKAIEPPFQNKPGLIHNTQPLRVDVEDSRTSPVITNKNCKP